MCVSVRRSPALVASVGLLKGSVPSLVGSSSPLATQIKKSKSPTLIKSLKFNFCLIHETNCSDIDPVVIFCSLFIVTAMLWVKPSKSVWTSGVPSVRM